MPEDLGIEEVANGVDQITTKEGKPQTMSGLQDHKLDQRSKQGDASFGAEASTVEHIFNCRVIIAKHLEHQRNLYHNFIDFKKAFDIVCHDGLWKVLIIVICSKNDGGFVQVIRALCDHPSSEVF